MDSELLNKLIEKIDNLESYISHVQSNWLDIPIAAEYLNISTSKIRKMISAGEIPFKRVGKNGKIIFNRKQIDLWLIYSKKTGFTKIERQRAEAFI